MGDGGKGIIQVVFQEGVLDGRKKTSCVEFEIKMQRQEKQLTLQKKNRSSFECSSNQSETLVLKGDKRGDIGRFSQRVEPNSYCIAQ